MQVGNSRSVEIRNFTQDGYYASQPNNMPGSASQPFIFEALIRAVDIDYINAEADQPRVIFANLQTDDVNNIVGGWAIFQYPSSDGDIVLGSRPYRLQCVVFNASGVQLGEILTVTVSSIMGRTLLLTGIFNPATGTLNTYANGGLVGTQTIEGFVYAPSPNAATIGASNAPAGAGLFPDNTTSVLGCMYSDSSIDVSSDKNTDQAMAQRFLETMKRGTVISELDISSVPCGYVYNAAAPGPISGKPPTVITNTGAHSGGDMTLVGGGEDLIATAAQTDWAAVLALVVPS